jgi:anti-sigma factor RsiW
MALNYGNDMEHDESLAKRYREAANESPPARLDAAIRAAARRDAGAGPRPLSRIRAWRVPVSLAAVLVLSATLVREISVMGGDVSKFVSPKVAACLKNKIKDLGGK